MRVIACRRCARGVVGATGDLCRDPSDTKVFSRTAWNGRPQGVKAP